MNLKTLAKELNLSISAVSKALRDSHEISKATKAAVIAKAKELNYQANPFASSLRKQKSKTIAVVVPEIDNNFFSLVINGIEQIAQEKEYHVLIYLTHDDTQKEISITKLLQNGRVDGIIMSLSSGTEEFEHIQVLRENNIPLVFFDRVPDNIVSPKVNTNDYDSSVKATEHLIEKGCKKMAFFSISDTLSISKKRKEGFCETILKHKLKLQNHFLVSLGVDDERNKTTIKKLLNKKNRPDGIFASVEKLALTTYEVCKELKLNIPRDIKILGYSNLKTADLLNPPLTTVTQPAYEIGSTACRILFTMVEKRGHHIIPEKTIINSNLIIRESTM
jgi:LacI family transcriptional regulator